MPRSTEASLQLAKTILSSRAPLTELFAVMIGEVMENNYECLSEVLGEFREEFEAIGAGDLFERIEGRIADHFQPFFNEEDDDEESLTASPGSPLHRPVIPDPWFEKIVEDSSGIPVAKFRTKELSLPDLTDTFIIPRDSLIERIKNLKAHGRPYAEEERALEALEPVYMEWAHKPWDGR